MKVMPALYVPSIYLLNSFCRSSHACLQTTHAQTEWKIKYYPTTTVASGGLLCSSCLRWSSNIVQTCRHPNKLPCLGQKASDTSTKRFPTMTSFKFTQVNKYHRPCSVQPTVRIGEKLQCDQSHSDFLSA